MIAAPPRLRLAARGAVLAAALFTGVALIGALPLGIPDNGDFRKYSRHFVEGPAGAASAIPRTFDDWRDAYRNRGWHRYWKLRPAGRPGPPPVVGTGPTPWLWTPGVALHRLLRPGPLLDATWIGLLPRLLLLLVAILVTAGVAREARVRRSSLLLLAIPAWPLLLTASAMTAYLNTFYREGGTLVFAALFVGALAVAPDLAPGRAATAAGATGALLVASAPAHGPLALIVALAVLDLARRGATPGRWRAAAAVAGAIGILLLGLWRMSAVDARLRQANAFNSIFLGLLPLSAAPQAHLEAMGLPPESAERIGEAGFNPRSRAWRRLHGDRLDHVQVLRMLAREPALLPRAALAASGILGRTSVQRRNLLAEDAPGPPPRFTWNLWGEWQRRWFPRGGGFLAWCLIAVPAGLAVRRLGDARLTATGRLVAFAAAGALLEVGFKFAADGPTEPTRHLVAANFLLGASLAGAVWLGLALCAARRTRAATGTIS